jgi:hypothetical protein
MSGAGEDRGPFILTTNTNAVVVLEDMARRWIMGEADFDPAFVPDLIVQFLGLLGKVRELEKPASMASQTASIVDTLIEAGISIAQARNIVAKASGMKRATVAREHARRGNYKKPDKNQPE